ncbi:hypothetical protein [Bradyrhizobium sp. 186]|uniref:hypothetical protein n=1 Tax=Bradyrhizobium sp. 186 TaxID=2782654 RepID=UPI002001750D|nr:hypothetical protein [Bradyrhizobium sp. 186]
MIEPALFGDTALLREWGRLGKRGRRRLDLSAGPGAGRRGARGLARAQSPSWLRPAKPHSCSERSRPPRLRPSDIP